MIHSKFTLIAFATLVLAGCGKSEDDDLNALDNQLVANANDPALSSALQDQILVDPTLSQQSNRNALRPPASPNQAQYPGGPQAAALRDSLAGNGACAQNLNYGPTWANRLPADFVLYPGSKLTEAAANERPECRVRIVSFLNDAAPQTVVDWYAQRLSANGYSTDQQVRAGDYILAGENEARGTAYFLIVSRKGKGSDASLITNNGR
jgi:hypothetical protein